MDLIKTYIGTDDDDDHDDDNGDVMALNANVQSEGGNNTTGGAVFDEMIWDTWQVTSQDLLDRENNESASVISHDDIVRTDYNPTNNTSNDCDSPWNTTSQDIATVSTPINTECPWSITSQEKHAVILSEGEEVLPQTPINFEYQVLLDHKVRSVYLVTYSQADIQRFNRRTFTEAVVACLNSGKGKVKQWVCCMKNHADGGHHFHMAVLLDRIKRWKSVKNQMADRYNVVLNFSDGQPNYHGAWNYVVKEDTNYLESPDHPRMSRNTAPRTSR